ncbi:Uncharacterized protein TCM_021085 [Theobroma cacao]|uniref:Uncharacterized protein n=1 Tax=Theobroma cacao TaxID=3641 RepID=A0A061EPQ5_THECC|nr:Uncharacterized protein TCM_021085 [Theobroma cacao]
MHTSASTQQLGSEHCSFCSSFFLPPGLNCPGLLVESLHLKFIETILVFFLFPNFFTFKCISLYIVVDDDGRGFPWQNLGAPMVLRFGCC